MKESNLATEKMIQEAGATAPRVTPEKLLAVIRDVQFLYVGLLTICVITLKNGFTVTGQSACVSPENYRKHIGDKIAQDNAENEIWPLEGYLLAQKLYEANADAAEPRAATSPHLGDFGGQDAGGE